jgi:hypothetical protein
MENHFSIRYCTVFVEDMNSLGLWGKSRGDWKGRNIYDLREDKYWLRGYLKLETKKGKCKF